MTVLHRLLACAPFLLVVPACGGHGSGDKAPIPVIVDPHDGESFLPANTIAFDGTATDPEDGVLTASALRWELRDSSNAVVLAFAGNGTQNVATAGDYTLFL